MSGAQAMRCLLCPPRTPSPAPTPAWLPRPLAERCPAPPGCHSALEAERTTSGPQSVAVQSSLEAGHPELARTLRHARLPQRPPKDGLVAPRVAWVPAWRECVGPPPSRVEQASPAPGGARVLHPEVALGQAGTPLGAPLLPRPASLVASGGSDGGARSTQTR